jgi:hypothetical protein
VEFAVNQRKLIEKLIGDISINNVSVSNVKLWLKYHTPPQTLEFRQKVWPRR